MIFKAEQLVNLVNQAHNAFDFVGNLFRGHEDVRIVLGKAAHTHQPVERAGFFVAVDKSQLAHANRQVAVGVNFRFINQHTARAVHRLNRKVGVVNDGGIHIFFVVVPVAGRLPKLTVEHHRGGNFDIALTRVDFAPIINQRVFKNHAFGQEERKARALIHQRKQL